MNFNSILNTTISLLGDYGLQKVIIGLESYGHKISSALISFYTLTLISVTTLFFMALSLSSIIVLSTFSFFDYNLPLNLSIALYTMSTVIFVISSFIFYFSYRKVNTKTINTDYESLTSPLIEIQNLLKQYAEINEKQENFNTLNKRITNMEDALLIIADSLKERSQDDVINSREPGLKFSAQ